MTLVGADSLVKMEFVNKWGLSNCISESGSRYYCSDHDAITFDPTKDGFNLTINSMRFDNYDFLIDQLKKSYAWYGKEDLSNMSTFVNSINPEDVVMFTGDNFSIMFAKMINGESISYAISAENEDFR